MKHLYILLFLLPLLFACKANMEKESPKEAMGTTATSGKDYFEHKVSTQLARHFEVSYHGNYKVVKTDATFYPNGKEASGEKRQDILLLLQEGTSPPNLTGPLSHATIINIPVKTVAVNVQHSESFLRELGLEDRINAIGGLYSYDDEMRHKALSGEIGQISYSWHGPPNMEVLLERNPEVFLMTMANLDHKSSLDKCRQLGIPTAAVFDWAEEEYLARAEWIKFYSLFFNAEQKANEVFQAIQSRVESLRSLTAKLENKESAMWGYYGSKQKWVMSISDFPGQYLRDAGLENVLLSNTKTNANGRQTLTTEELLSKAKEIDHWMIGDIHASPLPQASLMNSFRSWREENLYHNFRRVDPKSNSSDWYATAIVRPDTVLADLIKIIHPELLEDYVPVFMGLYDKDSEGPKALNLTQ
ncbi:MAG: ABC transporter substrate-binding protein [Bacteroidota bacterium]